VESAAAPRKPAGFQLAHCKRIYKEERYHTTTSFTLPSVMDDRLDVVGQRQRKKKTIYLFRLNQVVLPKNKEVKMI